MKCSRREGEGDSKRARTVRDGHTAIRAVCRVVELGGRPGVDQDGLEGHKEGPPGGPSRGASGPGLDGDEGEERGEVLPALEDDDFVKEKFGDMLEVGGADREAGESGRVAKRDDGRDDVDGETRESGDRHRRLVGAEKDRR